MKRRPWRMNLGNHKVLDIETRQFKMVPVVNDRRFSHTWLIGRTGVGKSTAMLRWMLDDIANGEGIGLIDPHGDLAEAVIARVPKWRRSDVIWFNPAESAVSFNIFDQVPEPRKAFVASALVDSMKAIWGYEDLPTPTLEQFLHNGARAMMDMPDGTLFGLKFLLTSSTYRKRVIAQIKDPVVADFWRTDFEQHMPEREQRERTLSTLNKIGTLIADPTIRNCISQSRNRIDFRDILQNRKVFIACLPQGQLGIDKASLIGSLLLSQLQLAALSRTKDRTGFHLYVDECHHFAPGTLSEMLSGIRKFGVSLVLAHQYLDQLPTKLRSAILGTVGTTVAFRTGVLDAKFIEPEFQLNRDDHSVCELAPYRTYVRLNDCTYHLEMPQTEFAKCRAGAAKIKRHSQSQLGTDIRLLDRKLRRFMIGINNAEHRASSNKSRRW